MNTIKRYRSIYYNHPRVRSNEFETATKFLILQRYKRKITKTNIYESGRKNVIVIWYKTNLIAIENTCLLNFCQFNC